MPPSKSTVTWTDHDPASGASKAIGGPPVPRRPVAPEPPVGTLGDPFGGPGGHADRTGERDGQSLAGADSDRRAREPRAVRAAVAPGERAQLTGDRVAALDRERRGRRLGG